MLKGGIVATTVWITSGADPESDLVERDANGNTLVVFSNKGVIQEVDSSWEVVQTLSAGTFGCADWRETMYGPPER